MRVTGTGRSTPGASAGQVPARPPGPPLRAWQIAWVAVQVLRDRAQPFTDVFADLARRYGDVVDMRTPEHSYVVSHPDLVRQVLVSDQRLTHKGRGLEFVRLLLGNGLLTAEDDEHLRNRRLVAPAFHHDHISHYATVMVDAATDTSAAWQERCAQGDVAVSMARQMSGLTLRIAGITLFGRDLKDRADAVGSALAQALEVLGFARVPAAGLVMRGPTPWARRLRSATATLQALVDDLIAEHRAHPDRFAPDVLTLLLDVRDDDGAALSDEQVRDEVMTLLLAGHETTANLLTWAWYLLDEHPDAAAALHAEVDALDGPPTPHHGFPPGLPYTRAVVAETLRLYPPAWTVGRRYVAPGEIGGFTVPTGTEVLTSQWVVHRDPRWWGDDAAVFRPERWLDGDRFDERAPGHPRRAFFPFGAGRRLCVGEEFAWTEGVLVLATLARAWRPRRVARPPVQPVAAITLRPRGGMPMVLEQR